MINKIVIIIPIYRTDLTHNEEISVQQCFKILSRHKIIFICPSKLVGDVFFAKYPSADVVDFEDSYFSAHARYNELMLTLKFYLKFKLYDYMLIHQTDCFVFKDELEEWVFKNYSYIGAPWVKNPKHENVTFIGVGNGGFSLRKVSDMILVLKSYKNFYNLKQSILIASKHNSIPTAIIIGIFKWLFWYKFIFIGRLNIITEDVLFYNASGKFAFFNVPSADIALKFSFELSPKKLFEMNNQTLPFGCHAWEKYEKDFYIPFIESFGYKVM